MTDARIGFRAGYVTIVGGQTIADVVFDSPMQDTNYEILFQPQQAALYDIWPTISGPDGFRANIFPVALVDLVYSYFVVDRSDVAAESLASKVAAISPVAWFKKGLGITSAATFVSQWADQSGHAHHLKQLTGTNQPVLQADGSILFDGIDNYMVCDAFTLIQPFTVYLLFRQITWTATDIITDGTTGNAQIYQQTSSPTVGMYAGLGSCAVDLALGDYGIVSGVFNGASSLIQLNKGAPAIGDLSTNDPGGFAMGANPLGPIGYANCEYKEAIIFAGAHDADTRAIVIQYLASVGALPI